MKAAAVPLPRVLTLAPPARDPSAAAGSPVVPFYKTIVRASFPQPVMPRHSYFRELAVSTVGSALVGDAMEPTVRLELTTC